jgi:hypothetical protein
MSQSLCVVRATIGKAQSLLRKRRKTKAFTVNAARLDCTVAETANAGVSQTTGS